MIFHLTKTLTLCNWILVLPKYMERQGLRVLAVERKTEQAFHHTIMTHLFYLVFKEYANVYLDSRGP